MADIDCDITGTEKCNTKDLETDFDYSEIREHQKLTMQKLAELKDKKVWESIFIRCYLCKEIKHISKATLIESCPKYVDHRVEGTGVFGAIEQVFEVVCLDCVKHIPKTQLFPEDIMRALWSKENDNLTIKELREKLGIEMEGIE